MSVHLRGTETSYASSEVTRSSIVGQASRISGVTCVSRSVLHIISFVGDIRKVSTLMFLVKWEGLTETTNEPRKNPMNNERLHQFLIKHKLRNLIPRKFQLNYTNSNTSEDIEMTVETQHISEREDGSM